MNAFIRLYEIARRFLKRQASISELRAAVRECEKELEKVAPTKVHDCGHKES